MTAFPHLLMKRELGLPSSQSKIKQTMGWNRANNIATNMANYRCQTMRIELPQNEHHRFSRSQDLVAILSCGKSDTVCSLALLSLSAQGVLWDEEIYRNYGFRGQHLNPKLQGILSLSERGMVLFDGMIVVEGKVKNLLPDKAWRKVIPVADRLIGCWEEMEKRVLGDSKEPKQNVYVGEWNQEGKLLNSFLLDNTEGRSNEAFAYDENFFVRLVGSSKAHLPSLIEVIDRKLGTQKAIELPLNQDQESFSSACIVKNQLVCGKNVIRDKNKKYEPTIALIHLVTGKFIGEFSSGAKRGEVTGLVASERYIAWLEEGGRDGDQVKFLDILANKVMEATTISGSKFSLNIEERALTVIYYDDEKDRMCWRRKVVDMTNGSLLSDFSYLGHLYANCSLANGQFLLAHGINGPEMYIERFI